MPSSIKKIRILNEYARDILANEKIKSMKDFIQHGDVSTLQHSISVAYLSFLFAKKLNIKVDTRSLVRGALLHDFFLYDWHFENEAGGLHGFKHPKIALKNAEEYFLLNEREKDIIAKHMWPMTIILPRYKEALIVCLMDKYSAIIETFQRFKN
jgi:uncharacterized protein